MIPPLRSAWYAPAVPIERLGERDAAAPVRDLLSLVQHPRLLPQRLARSPRPSSSSLLLTPRARGSRRRRRAGFRSSSSIVRGQSCFSRRASERSDSIARRSGSAGSSSPRSRRGRSAARASRRRGRAGRCLRGPPSRRGTRSPPPGTRPPPRAAAAPIHSREHVLRRGVQPRHLRRVEPGGELHRGEPRPVQDLVRVGVADPGEQRRDR